MTDLVSFTEGDAAETAMCKKIADVLQRFYPGHPWLIGLSDIEKGMVVIDLPERFKPPSLRNFGFLLHPRNYDDEGEIRKAGGEWLERLSIARTAASRWAQDLKFGQLDASNMVEKSRA